MPDARSILLAWPTAGDARPSGGAGSGLASSLAEAYRSAGIEAALLSLPAESDLLLTVDELGKELSGNRLTVVEGSGLLDSPNTVLAARAVDAVVVLARRGHTRRSDLVASRRELTGAGAPVVGAVLIA